MNRRNDCRVERTGPKRCLHHRKIGIGPRMKYLEKHPQKGSISLWDVWESVRLEIWDCNCCGFDEFEASRGGPPSFSRAFSENPKLISHHHLEIDGKEILAILFWILPEMSWISISSWRTWKKTVNQHTFSGLVEGHEIMRALNLYSSMVDLKAKELLFSYHPQVRGYSRVIPGIDDMKSLAILG